MAGGTGSGRRGVLAQHAAGQTRIEVRGLGPELPRETRVLRGDQAARGGIGDGRYLPHPRGVAAIDEGQDFLEARRED